jgi:glycosyltransferase involved in cell wall biosynthesis
MPKISIVIPAYNEENYIKQTLHSIKTQIFQDFEVIVVANGCTDKTEQIVKKRVNDKIKLFSMGTANVSRARNYGADKTEGQTLVFLDADTVLEPDTLYNIYHQFDHAIATTKVKPDISNTKYNAAMALKNFYNKAGIYKGCSGILICKKDDFNKVNGYDPELIVKEHRKLILKLIKLGKHSCLDTYVTTSMRRFQRWGLIKATWFWALQLFKDKTGHLKESDYEKVR